MIKREYNNSDIKTLAARVNLAEWTVKEGSRINGEMQGAVINSVRMVVDTGRHSDDRQYSL